MTKPTKPTTPMTREEWIALQMETMPKDAPKRLEKIMLRFDQDSAPQHPVVGGRLLPDGGRMLTLGFDTLSPTSHPLPAGHDPQRPSRNRIRNRHEGNSDH